MRKPCLLALGLLSLLQPCSTIPPTNTPSYEVYLENYFPSTLQKCNELLSLLQSSANQDYIGESISQLDHALQCAHLATQAGADTDTILAALFHDIGHLCGSDNLRMGDYGISDHDIIGARFLASYGLSNKVCELVLGHVQAKRYLTYISPSYYHSLSDASKITLQMQGGPMSCAQAAVFENDSLFNLKIQMRSWDEQAKLVEAKVPDLSTYREMLLEHLSINRKTDEP